MIIMINEKKIATILTLAVLLFLPAANHSTMAAASSPNSIVIQNIPLHQIGTWVDKQNNVFSIWAAGNVTAAPSSAQGPSPLTLLYYGWHWYFYVYNLYGVECMSFEQWGTWSVDSQSGDFASYPNPPYDNAGPHNYCGYFPSLATHSGQLVGGGETGYVVEFSQWNINFGICPVCVYEGQAEISTNLTTSGEAVGIFSTT
jgi:hypothetical protein